MTGNRPEEPASSSQGMTVEEIVLSLRLIRRYWPKVAPTVGFGDDPVGVAAIEQAIAMLELAPSLEAEAAILRQALQQIATVGLCNTGVNLTHTELWICKENIAKEVLQVTTAGQALLDRIKALEGESRHLRTLAEGCRIHPGYRAKRPPTTVGCDCCEAVWAARNALKEAGQ